MRGCGDCLPNSHLELTPTIIDHSPHEELSIDERQAIEAILANDDCPPEPFSHVGWIQQAIEWLRSEVGHDVALTEEIRQYNAGERFALVRFRSQSGPIFWLKATGEPNSMNSTSPES